MFVQPQEIEVWYVIPAIRRELALKLKEKSMNQKDIAKNLGITEPAVSQYLKEKRAKKIKFNQELEEKIKEAARKIINKESSSIKEIQLICREIRKSGMLCKLHKEYNNNCNCGVCLR